MQCCHWPVPMKYTTQQKMHRLLWGENFCLDETFGVLLLLFFLCNTNCHSTNPPPLSLLPEKLLKFLEFPKRTEITFPATGVEITSKKLFKTKKNNKHQTPFSLTFPIQRSNTTTKQHYKLILRTVLMYKDDFF